MVNNRSGKAQMTPTRRFCMISLVVCVALLLLAELLWTDIAKHIGITDPTLSDMLKMTFTRLTGGFFVSVIILYLGFDLLSFKKMEKRDRKKEGLILIPCFAVAINNFPFIAVITGSASMNKPLFYIPLLLLQCLSIALFEEMAFRGMVLLTLLERRREKVGRVILAIILSSAVFGSIHLLNLFAGAGFGSVMQQIGYSALIGAMCSCVLLRTGNIFYCILLHGCFDFGGYFISDLATGSFWDVPTVIITVLLAVVAFVWLLLDILKLDTGMLDHFFSKSSSVIPEELKNEEKMQKNA